MYTKVQFPISGININLLQVLLLCILIPTFAISESSPTAVLLNANPVSVRRVFYHPFRIVKKRKSPPFYDGPSRSDEDYYYDDNPTFSGTDAFHIQVDDAVDNVKYSSPVIESNPIRTSYPPYGENFTPSFYPVLTGVQKPSFQPNYHSKDSYDRITKDHIQLSRDSIVTEATVTSNYKILSDEPTKDKKHLLREANKPHLFRNNFTEINGSQLFESSDKISKSGPVMLGDDSRYLNNKHLQTDITSATPKINFNVTTTVPFMENKTTVKVTTDIYPNFNTHSLNISTIRTSTNINIDLTDNGTWTTSNSFDEKDNFSRILPPIGNSRGDISPGALAGVVIAILTAVTILSSSVIYLLYKKFNGKCTSVVDSKFNSDNCGYLDDSLRSSIYLNNHIELPKENSEEMTSLDNDSFLNSLETMTIQNYWADNTKNTKV